jgi:UDP-N-acetylglucosamine diphosphorylase/glucosamine-1-phosphate N-acetyltransferase
MNIILFEDFVTHSSLLPLTYTRPVSDLRIGILKIAEKWEKHLIGKSSFLTQPYLQEKFSFKSDKDNLYINGAVCPNKSLLSKIEGLQTEQSIIHTPSNTVLAFRSGKRFVELRKIPEFVATTEKIPFRSDTNIIKKVTDIFLQNAKELELDFKLLSKNRRSEEINDPHTVVYGEKNIFIEKGATIHAATLNASKGFIYIGKNAHIEEGAILRGNCAVGESSTIKMGAKIRDNVSIGKHCKVGGEVSMSVIQDYSNKGHDGFLGHSVVGSWCNFGADTNVSNLKNNYSSIKVWDYETKQMKDSGLQFCGLIMGDHSKTGINTMFNTGTIVGVAANVFGASYPPKFITSFTWGNDGLDTFRFEDACQMAERMMERRKIKFTPIDKDILKNIFEQSQVLRDSH